MLGLCAFLALVVTRSEQRLEGTMKDLRSRSTIEANPIVKAMKEYASRTKWVYSESGIYPFHAQLEVRPDLAIIMPKRFWSGQISTSEIVEACKRYQPELLVLPKSANMDEWKGVLDTDYENKAMDRQSLLYVSKRVLGSKNR